MCSVHEVNPSHAVVNHIASIPRGDLILKKLKNKLNTDMPSGPGA